MNDPNDDDDDADDADDDDDDDDDDVNERSMNPGNNCKEIKKTPSVKKDVRKTE